MAVERFANLIATPASDADDNGLVTTLAAAVVDTTGTSLTVAAAAPASLQSGQFRIRIDNEIMVVTAGQSTTTWTVTRGAEGSTAATHANGAKIRHYLTAASLLLAAVPDWQDLGNLGATETITAAPRASKLKGTLDQACAVTVSMSAGELIELQLAQDGIGGRAATFTGVNVWMTANGTAPGLANRAALAVDRFAFENVGGTVYGYWLTETVVTDPYALLRPTGAVRATFPRAGTPFTAQSALASGRRYLVAIPLLAGDVVTTIAFVSGATALATGSNQWFELLDSSRTRLAVTADDGATAWPASTEKALNLTAPYTVVTSGLYYLGICVVATTVPNLQGVSSTSPVQTIAPVLCGNSDTGLTTPASAPSPAAALTMAGQYVWAYVK